MGRMVIILWIGRTYARKATLKRETLELFSESVESEFSLGLMGAINLKGSNWVHVGRNSEADPKAHYSKQPPSTFQAGYCPRSWRSSLGIQDFAGSLRVNLGESFRPHSIKSTSITLGKISWHKPQADAYTEKMTITPSFPNSTAGQRP